MQEGLTIAPFGQNPRLGVLAIFFVQHLCNHCRLTGLIAANHGTGIFIELAGPALLLLLVGMGLLIFAATGMRELPFIQIWVPPWEWRELTFPMMLGACILMTSGFFPRARLHVHLRRPVEMGALLWGLSHLLSNGDLVSMLAFGLLSGIALLSLATRFQHGGPAEGGGSVGWDIAAILAGSIVWVTIIVLHGHLFGVAVDMIQQ